MQLMFYDFLDDGLFACIALSLVAIFEVKNVIP